MQKFQNIIPCAECGKPAKFLYRSYCTDPGIYRCGACGADTDAETGTVCGGGLTDAECQQLGIKIRW